MDIHKKYNSYTIPDRKQTEENKEFHAADQSSSKEIELDFGVFAEIEINQTNTGYDPVPVPVTQSLKPATDEKRKLFYAMRKIERDNFFLRTDVSYIFYHQGLFMKDFEDDYEQPQPFASYYPCYQKMGHEQLRTYFSWRTQVRKGNITETSLSYAFLYIYELLNNIGVTCPEDGLDKLMKFWQAYRVFDTVIDRYILQWIKDYHIYYPLPQSFHEFASEHHLQMHYPTVFVFESGQNGCFDLFADISKYKIKKSAFYSGQTSQLINNCFYFVLNQIRKIFREKNMHFEDYIIYPIGRESIWVPFSRALFYQALKQPDRQVIISEREVYTCRYNKWKYETVILSDQGSQITGYIMKEMEASLRKASGFKHKIKANPDMCGKDVLTMFEAAGISLPQIIRQGVTEFYSIFTRKIVTVNINNLKQIRQEAMNTQEKLIVPEQEEAHSGESLSLKPEPAVVLPVTDIWTGLKEILTQIELEAIKILLQEKDIKGFADQNRIMLEVLLDGINQKAMDCIGDTVLELDNTVIIYDEYRTKLIEMVK